jgi:hypothetical protein
MDKHQEKGLAMNAQHLLDKEPIVSGFCDDIDLCISKLTRFSKNLTTDELKWKPPGIKNSLSWIIMHLTTQILVCYALVTEKQMEFDPLAAGVALKAVRGIEFGREGQLPFPPEDEPMKLLKASWKKLRAVLEDPDQPYEHHQVYADRKMRSAWWFLIHSLSDFAYHTGQASSLRKLIIAARKRVKR